MENGIFSSVKCIFQDNLCHIAQNWSQKIINIVISFNLFFCRNMLKYIVGRKLYNFELKYKE